MTALASPATLTELDEQTIAEITPNCQVCTEVEKRTDPQTADIIFRTTCPRCERSSTVLLCTPHVQMCAAWARSIGICTSCRRASRNWTWTTEPLR